MRRVIATCLWIAILFAATISAARPKWNQLDGYTFDRFMKDFGRQYPKDSPEYHLRRATFEKKLAAIRQHNADPYATWKRGVNAFSDMTEIEWRQFNRARVDTNLVPTRLHSPPPPSMPLPEKVDYRQATSPRVLTAVKHQGSCGNCWAQSAAETLESYFALLTGRLPVLSTQQLTSCTAASHGCNGGNPVEAWLYINSTVHGLTEEWAYPFSNFFYNFTDPNATTAACQNVTDMYPNKVPYTWFAELTRVGIQGYVQVESNSARANLHALATVGPISVFVAAGNWQDYESGIMQNTNATGGDNEWAIDHVVQLIGYGTDKELGRDYWLVRNSWSTNWGEDGFVRLDRPAVEPCSPSQYGPVCGTSGVLYYNNYPLVKELPPTDF